MSLDPITGLETLADDALNKFIPDPNAKLQEVIQLATAQTTVNAAEATSKDLFTSGWRPFIGWVCGLAFAYKFLIQPFIIFMVLLAKIDFNPSTLPVLDATEMSTVLMGMLGLGAMRTFEKHSGVA